jgi:hypothetical protein
MNAFRCVTPLFGLFALFGPTQTSQAEASIYGTVALTDYGFSNSSNTLVKSDSGGFIAGMFYNFPIHSRLTAGIDGRGSYSIGPRGGTSAAVSLRIGFVPGRVVLRPYFQIGGGFVSSTLTLQQADGDAFQGLGIQPTRYTSGGAEFAVGLDIRLTKFFDLRAFELGAVGGGGSGASTGVSSAFIHGGVVYHIHQHP